MQTFLPTLRRRCQLSVEVAPDAKGVTHGNITFPPDLTVEFQISRNFLGSSQEAMFRVSNLAPATRQLVVKDAYALTEFRAIQFRAGKWDDDSLALCFNGFVRYAGTQRRSGATDVVTEIAAYDGGMAIANGFTSQSVAAGVGVKQVITDLARTLPRISGTPIVGDFPGVNYRGKALFGNTWNLLLQESGNLATIDNNQVKVLQTTEGIVADAAAKLPVISSESGLLGTPRRSQTQLEVDILFEPRLTVGQLIELRSPVNPLYNGTYKVAGFTHRGVISPAQGGQATSTVTLFFGDEEFKRVQARIVQ